MRYNSPLHDWYVLRFLWVQMCVCCLNVDISFLGRVDERLSLLSAGHVNSLLVWLPGMEMLQSCWWSGDGDECRHRTMGNTLGYWPSPQHPRGCPVQTYYVDKMDFLLLTLSNVRNSVISLVFRSLKVEIAFYSCCKQFVNRSTSRNRSY